MLHKNKLQMLVFLGTKARSLKIVDGEERGVAPAAVDGDERAATHLRAAAL